MKLFGQIIGAVVETACLPIALAKDVLDVAVGEPPRNTAEQIEKIKESAKEPTHE